jgi:hypothetical protein
MKGVGGNTTVKKETDETQIINLDFSYTDVGGDLHKTNSAGMFFQDNHKQVFDVNATGQGTSFKCQLIRQ